MCVWVRASCVQACAVKYYCNSAVNIISVVSQMKSALHNVIFIRKDISSLSIFF